MSKFFLAMIVVALGTLIGLFVFVGNSLKSTLLAFPLPRVVVHASSRRPSRPFTMTARAIASSPRRRTILFQLIQKTFRGA
jgi:hypothetical protein